MLHTLFAAWPELAIFAALTVGYAIGAIKIGPFQLGGVAGTLLAALVIGQIGVHIDPSLQRFMFTLFIYALGFSVAPQFFASVDRTTWTWTLLVIVEVALILTVVFVAAYLFKLDVGTASGLLAGAATESAMVGTASEAIGRLGLSPAAAQAFQANVATAYALSYIFGLITIVLFASQAAPWLLRIDLRSEARRVLAELGGADLNLDSDQSYSFPSLISRGFRVVAAAGKTVAAVEAELGGDATISGVRRGDGQMPLTRAILLNTGDEVAVSGLRRPLADATLVIGPELGDPTDVKFIVETRDVVFTHRPMHGSTIADITKFLRTSECHGVYLAGITRMERILPPLPGAVVRLGDVLRLFGKPEDVARAAHLLGEAKVPNNVTDFVYLGGGLVIGILIGMVTIPFAGASLSLGSAGALLSGLAFGWLRSRRPTFGSFPPAATQILKDLGLTVYIASIGLTSAPSILALLEKRGWELPIAAIFLSLLPPLASLYIGRYLLHIEPAILCGAIAGQHASTPAINATEAVAGNPVPVIGYTVTYAIANVLLPLLGPVFVAVFAATHTIAP
jgi:aspartate-alanine antiporter